MPLSDNIKIIRQFQKVSVKELADKMEIAPQSIYDWERGDYEPNKENLENLSKFLNTPKETFHVENLTKEYLEKNFSGKNNTQMPKSNENNGTPNPDEVWSQVEKSEKYTVVPTIILDKYEILSNREIESRETTLQEVRATMKIAIAAKDQVISFLEAEIEDLRSRLKQIPPTQDAQ